MYKLTLESIKIQNDNEIQNTHTQTMNNKNEQTMNLEQKNLHLRTARDGA